MNGFAERLKACVERKESRIVLALDIVEADSKNLLAKAKKMLSSVSEAICAVKLNHHILLPLNLFSETKSLVDLAHNRGLEVIADLKLNDIAETNLVATSYLWSAGFDSVIVNPIAGFEGGLQPVIEEAHSKGKGVITLVYMSHPGAKEYFDLTIAGDQGSKKMYELILEASVRRDVDGIVVGATSPSIIAEIAHKLVKRPLIFSPGVGVQGGDARLCVEAGADLLIVGRAIISSRDPVSTAENIRQETWIPFSDRSDLRSSSPL